MKSTRAFLHFEWNTQVVVFILKEPNCSSSPRQKYFSFAKKRIHFTVNTKSKNTKTIMCSSWSKRHSSPSNLLFLENFNFLVDQPKLNHSWFQKNQKTLPRDRMSRPSQNVRPRTKHHQMQMLILNRLRLKTRLFSNTVSLWTMMCLRQSL